MSDLIYNRYRQITFRLNTTARMTTTKSYDYLNRLTQISSQPSASGEAPISFNYALNDANQRTRVTHADGSYWSYEYDNLGQVTSGKKYWDDGNPVAGQQFEYAYDDIGNRTSTKEGGDSTGGNLRSATYVANLLNQYTNRTVSGTADIIGVAKPDATVTVNGQSTYRRGEYYHAAISNDNAAAILYPGYTNRAVLSGETNTTTGNLLIAKTPQSFWFDLDGSMLSDGVWTNTWTAENRTSATENTSDVPNIGRAKETWTYDDQGRWVQLAVSVWSGSSYVPQYTNRFVWDRMLLVAILADTRILKASFLRGIDQSGTPQRFGGVGGMIAADLQTNGINFSVYDGNGNIRALVNGDSGSATGSYDYDPFGGALRLTGSAATENPIRFSSQFRDDTAGMWRYLYRDLHVSAGRWQNRDPIEENGGVNVYGFVKADPVNLVDPDGRVPHGPPNLCGDCNGKTFYIPTQCCCNGKVVAKKAIPTGVVKHKWEENPDGAGKVHVWVTWNGGSADSNSDYVIMSPGSQLVSSPAGQTPSPSTSTQIKLSPCDYDFSKLHACLTRTANALNGQRGGDCRAFANSLIDDCIAESSGCTAP